MDDAKNIGYHAANFDLQLVATMKEERPTKKCLRTLL